MPSWSQFVRAGRQRRFDRFVERLRRPATPPLRLLDVGGTPAYWAEIDWRRLEPVEIVLFNVTAPPVSSPFQSVAGDARDLSRYADQSFDVVYSNSVIGHVGTFADQARMAREVQRVGRCYVLQTPNRWFPIDWRTLVPGFHFLPVRLQAWCFRHLRVGRYAKAPSAAAAWQLATRVRNMSRRELRSLFPGAVLHRERVLGLAKSFVVEGSHPIASGRCGHSRQAPATAEAGRASQMRAAGGPTA